MRVEIPESVFSVEATSGELLALVMMCVYEWPHRILVLPDGSGALERWRLGLPESVREDLGVAMEDWHVEDASPAEITTGRNTVLITEGDSRWETRPVELHLRAVLPVLDRCFEVRLENSRTDRAFVLSMARREWRERLIEWERREWLRFVHGGGFPQIKNDFRKWLAENRGSPGVPRRLRLWYVIDSDRLRPSSKAAKDPRALDRLCRSNGVGIWLLERRFSESYLPPDAIRRWSAEHQRPLVWEAWCRLSVEQRRYANLKHGIERDLARPRLHPEDRAFWEAVDPATRQEFDTGFGEALKEVFETDGLAGRFAFDPDAQRETNDAIAEMMGSL